MSTSFSSFRVSPFFNFPKSDFVTVCRTSRFARWVFHLQTPALRSESQVCSLILKLPNQRAIIFKLSSNEHPGDPLLSSTTAIPTTSSLGLSDFWIWSVWELSPGWTVSKFKGVWSIIKCLHMVRIRLRVFLYSFSPFDRTLVPLARVDIQVYCGSCCVLIPALEIS